MQLRGGNRVQSTALTATNENTSASVRLKTENASEGLDVGPHEARASRSFFMLVYPLSNFRGGRGLSSVVRNRTFSRDRSQGFRRAEASSPPLITSPDPCRRARRLPSTGRGPWTSLPQGPPPRLVSAAQQYYFSYILLLVIGCRTCLV